MKKHTIGSLLVLPAIALIATSASALTNEEVAEDTNDDVNPQAQQICSVWLKEGDPVPEEKQGMVICIVKDAPPNNSSSLYSYPANDYADEASYSTLCQSAKAPCTGCELPPPPVAPAPWSVSWSYGDKKGSGIFKAGVLARAALRAEPDGVDAAGEHDDRLSATASLRATATMFNVTKDLAKIEVAADAEYGKTANARAKVLVGTSLLLDTSSTMPLELATRKSAQLLSGGMSFGIGPIPAYVSGSINGEVGIDGKVGPEIGADGPQAVGVRATATPYARLFAKSSVGIGKEGFVSFGVEGELTLVKASVPSSGVLMFRPRADGAMDASWYLSSDLVLSTMDGKLSAFVQFIATWRKTIFEWDGVSKTIPLFHLSSCRSTLSPAG